MTTALTTVDPNTYAILDPETGDIAGILEDNIGSGALRASDLPQVKIPTGGAKKWTVPTIDGEQTVDAIEGVIVAMVENRSYWKAKFTGGNTPPDCFSDDMLVGQGDPGGPCGKCPMNKWGSHPDGGAAKACKERHTLFMIRAQDVLPIAITVTPGSAAALRKYMVGLSVFRRRFSSVVTSISLTKTKSSTGIDFAQIVPVRVTDLDGEQAKVFRQYGIQFTTALMNAPFDDEEQQTEWDDPNTVGMD